MKILASTGIGYKNHTLTEFERLAIDLGYDGVEVNPPPRHLSRGEAQRDAQYGALQYAEVIHAAGDIFDYERFTGSLDEAISIARQSNCNRINIHPASHAIGGRENVTKAIHYLLQQQDATGIEMLYEVLVDPNGIHEKRREIFREQQAYFSVDDWVADVKDYDLNATLDTCHLGTWNVDPSRIAKQLGSHLKHIHFSDYSSALKQEHLVPSAGNVDLKAFIATVASDFADITLTVEIMPPGTKGAVWQVLQESIRYIRDTITI